MRHDRTARGPRAGHQSDNHRGNSAHQSGIVDAMRALPQIGSLSYTGLKVVAATRLLALCGRTDRDPLLELTQRFACVTTAKAFIALADCTGAYWPDSVQVMRPCCAIVSPDEQALAQMVDAARTADRACFERVLAGLVRPERHELLFNRAVELVAVMQ